ncbi:MAG: hypothetical protein O7C67_02745 [Gammaproteobacteria bacterium]|nr:hypothetical protein [Gammaproteobacteria bacterium]
MSDINVDDFFKDAAKVLNQLYGMFPRRHTVFVEDICGFEEPDEFGMPTDRHLACLGTLLWLGEEGFLRYEDVIRQEAIDLAVLTGRCFTALCSPTTCQPAEEALPESVRAERSTHIYQLRGALSAKSSTTVRAAMLELMSTMDAR